MRRSPRPTGNKEDTPKSSLISRALPVNFADSHGLPSPLKVVGGLSPHFIQNWWRSTPQKRTLLYNHAIGSCALRLGFPSTDSRLGRRKLATIVDRASSPRLTQESLTTKGKAHPCVVDRALVASCSSSVSLPASHRLVSINPGTCKRLTVTEH